MKRLIKLAALAICLLSRPVAAQVAGLSSLADLVEQLQPAVVNISTTPSPSDSEDGNEMLGIASTNPKIADYFSPHNPQQVALGSGFIISQDGYIITNNHVIDNASEVMVTLADNTQFKAELIGKDYKTDIALIKINAGHDLPKVKIGDSDKIRVGDWIVAIGNPFGLGGSVTAGIVSAKSRDIEAGPYDSFIQTDASINQGSSGGPMFNLDGEVIGINTAIFSTNGGSMGIGFAVPINLTDFVVKELKSKGKVERGWIGIKIQTNSTELAATLQQNAQRGVVVSAVTEKSPAATAGIEAGDIILKLNNEPIDNTKNFSRMIAETSPNSSVTLELWRNRQTLNKELKVQLMPEAPAPALPTAEKSNQAATENEQPSVKHFAEMDLTLSELTSETRNQYNISADKFGVMIQEVNNGSDAESKGLRKGNLITQIDKKPVFSLEDIDTALNEAIQENYRPVLLLVFDQSLPHYVVLKIQENYGD